jgi:hypothetical protein
MSHKGACGHWFHNRGEERSGGRAVLRFAGCGTLNLFPCPGDQCCGAASAARGIQSVKVIRPDRNEAPIVQKRSARANPGMPDAVIRLALFALVAIAAVVAFVVLRR